MKCLQCNKILGKRQFKYCSKSCAGRAVGTNSAGKSSWNKGLKGFRAGEKRPYMSIRKGPEHWSWKGGPENWKRENRRGDSGHVGWSLEVKKRDGWKCKMANDDCVDKVQAHHILSWREYPELRYNINNGITLCLAHHPRKRAEEKRLAPIFQELVTVSSKQF